MQTEIVVTYVVYLLLSIAPDRLGGPDALQERTHLPRGRVPRQRGPGRLGEPPAGGRLLPDQPGLHQPHAEDQ